MSCFDSVPQVHVRYKTKFWHSHHTFFILFILNEYHEVLGLKHGDSIIFILFLIITLNFWPFPLDIAKTFQLSGTEYITLLIYVWIWLCICILKYSFYFTSVCECMHVPVPVNPRGEHQCPGVTGHWSESRYAESSPMCLKADHTTFARETSILSCHFKKKYKEWQKRNRSERAGHVGTRF